MLKILIMLLFSISANATTYVGVNHGNHFLNNNLNNTHPYISFENEEYGISYFLNSFERLSLAGYRKFGITNEQHSFNLRVGVTTGYSKDNLYKGRIYTISNALFPIDDVMFVIVPEYRYNINGLNYFNASVLGDSLSFGFGFEF